MLEFFYILVPNSFLFHYPPSMKKAIALVIGLLNSEIFSIFKANVLYFLQLKILLNLEIDYT